MNVKICSVSMLAGVAFAVRAETWTWTGAADNYWTNAANWTVGGEKATTPPGTWKDDAGAKVGDFDATASFGSLAAETATIDVDGLFDIKTIVIPANTTTKYTFGLPDQVLALHSTGGVFRVEAGAKAPVVAADFGVLRCAPPSNVNSWNVGSTDSGEGKSDFPAVTPVVENNSSEELEFKKFFYNGYKAYYHHVTTIKGTGNIRISGRSTQSYSGNNYNILNLQQSGSRLILACDIPANYGIYDMRSHRLNPAVVEIAEGATWNLLGDNASISVGRGGKMTICGDGTLTYTATKKTAGSDKGSYISSIVTIPSGSSLKLDVRQTSTYYPDQDYYANFFTRYYAGSVTMTAKNETRGLIYMHSSEAKTLAVTSIGLGKETNSCLGYSDLQMVAGCTLSYSGAGETCDRTLYITNSTPFQYNQKPSARTPKAGISHVGSGDLVWNGPILAPGVAASENPQITFHVDGASRTMTFGGELDANLRIVKSGSGTLRIATNLVNTGLTKISAGKLTVTSTGSLSALSPLEIAASTTLTFEGDGTERTLVLSNLTQTAGTTTINVQNGTTLAISNLTYTAGSIAVVRSGASEVRVLDAALKGTTPAWLTFNGTAATIAADGTVVPTTQSNSLAARGDQIPNKPGEKVTVFKIGTTGPDTLAADAVMVKELAQAAPVVTEIALGAQQALTADVVSVSADAKALKVGLVEGQGVLAPSNEVLRLTSASTTEGVSVAAKTAADVVISTTEGATNVVAGGFEEETSVRVTAGSLMLTGEEPIKLNGFYVGTNESVSSVAKLQIVNASNVQLSTGRFYAVSTSYTGDPYWTGKKIHNDNWATVNTKRGDLVISNATIVAEEPTAALFAEHSCRESICVGHTGWGVCTIEPETVITSRLSVGCGCYSNARSPYGCLYQRGGSVNVWSTSSKSYPGFAVGFMGGAGYYHLGAGSLTVLKGDMAVGQWALGVFAQDGGTVKIPGTLRLANENGGKGFVRVSGGTFTAGAANPVNASSGGFANILVENVATFKVTDPYGITGSMGSSSPSAVCESHFNVISGATVEAAGFQLGAPVKAFQGVRKFAVGFNGGTFKAIKDVGDMFYANGYTTSRNVTNIYVYAGGVTIDTGTNTVGCGSSFQAPTGLGVTEIPLEKPFACNSEPLVRIVGDGFGATAVAIFDPTNLCVTGFRVTSAGSGYSTTATAKIYKTTNSDSAAASYACTLGPVVSGGLVKTGEGKLWFNVANTYAGATVVEAGTLVLNATNALPTGSTLVFAGGQVRAQRPEYFPSSVTVGQTIPEEITRLSLATFPNGTPETIPTLVGLNPVDWRLSLTASELRLVRRGGFQFFVR